MLMEVRSKPFSLVACCLRGFLFLTSESSEGLSFARAKILLRNEGGALEGIASYRLSKVAAEKSVESVVDVGKSIVIMVTMVLEIFNP